MNKINLFTLLVLMLGISSCDISSITDSSISPQDSILNSSSLSEESSSEDIVSSVDSFDSEITSEEIEMLSLTLNEDSCSKSLFNYQDNFGDFYSAVRFEYYRANKQSNELLHLSSYSSITGVEGLPSAFYNALPLYDIRHISLTYSTSMKTNEKPTIKFGRSRYYEVEEELDLSTSDKTIEFDVNNTNFFCIETLSNSLSIKEMTFYYSNIKNDISFTIKGSGESEYRINTPTYQEDLHHDESNILLPTKISLIGDNYDIEEEKKYTYYDYQEVRNNPTLANDAALIDPVDVANYFISFNTWPANYVYKNNYSEAYKIFKEKTRCVSKYSRTDGYARSVPYNTGSNGKPLYFECDIALDDSYSNSNRGTGRLVVWYYGFDEDKGAKDYQENLPVAVYTDDHYFTFREYLGDGRFSKNFDAEGSRTRVEWSCPKTLLNN